MRCLSLCAIVAMALLLLPTLPVVNGIPAKVDVTYNTDGIYLTEKSNGIKNASRVENPWVAYAPVKPAKKVTLVYHDPSGFIDDYAYIASVPANTFYSKGKIYGSPILFYEEPHQGNEEELVLNGSQSIGYFLEDYVNYSASIDYVEYINMDANAISQMDTILNGKHKRIINSKDIYTIAKKIAENNWEYASTAVIAVIYPKTKFNVKVIEGSIEGSVEGGAVAKGQFKGEIAPTPTEPVEHEFDIGDGYVFIEGTLTWGNPNNPLTVITERGKDPDLQLYDMQLGQVAASEDWNVITGPSEFVASYVYHSGKWKFAVTYMPTEAKAMQYASIMTNKNLNIEDIWNNITLEGKSGAPRLPGIIDPTAYYQIDYTVYPGKVIEIPEEVDYGSRNLRVTLEWSGGGEMGMCLIDPNGAEVESTFGTGGKLEILMDTCGKGRYKVAVFSHEDGGGGGNFKLSYTWETWDTLKWSQGLEASANAAVLATALNAPLLYSKATGLNRHTRDALNLLGVTTCYVVSLGSNPKGLINDLKTMRSWLQPPLNVEVITSERTLFSKIHSITKSSDIIFTTTNPWSYWYIGKGPQGEFSGALHIAPSALAGAHHGAPVIVVDNHEETASAQAWHNAFWERAYPDRLPPSVGAMVLSAEATYGYLRSVGLDKPGEEYILTIGGQFDIGISWDRAIVGAAFAGRMFGSPVDESVWVSRSAFYPAVIYANPALNPNGVNLWTGSHSTRIGGALVITEDEKEVVVKYPTLQTWVSYQHRFNERGADYWGCPYTDSLGITPFFTPSDDPLDDGICEPYKSGSYYPDMTESEVIPKYMEKGGLSSVFTTNFPKTMENLNRGVIIWFEVMHGGNRDDGIVGFWNHAQPEPNPWRGYEENAFTLRGSTDEPDVSTMSKIFGLDATPGFSGPLGNIERHDGIVIAILQQADQTIAKGGLDFDRALGNIHSVGFNGGSCLIAATYLQLALIRHGSVFQVIDPWLTSWYSAFAMEIFAKGLVKGKRVGECFAEGIHHVGIEYLTKKWWWDIFENVCFYGDPKLLMWTPNNGWQKPETLRYGVVIDGHAIYGAKNHPRAIGDTFAYEMMIYAGIVATVVALAYGYKTRKINKVMARLRNQQK